MTKNLRVEQGALPKAVYTSKYSAGNFWPYAGGHSKQDLQAAYKTLAYAINKRMQRLEKAVQAEGGVIPNSYKLIQDHLGINARFSTSGNRIEKMTIKDLQDEISFIQSSLSKKTTTRTGWREAKVNRRKALIENAGMPADVSDSQVKAFEKFLKSDVYKTLEKTFAYKEIWELWSQAQKMTTKNGKAKYTPETIYERFIKYTERMKKQKNPSLKGMRRAILGKSTINLNGEILE